MAKTKKLPLAGAAERITMKIEKTGIKITVDNGNVQIERYGSTYVLACVLIKELARTVWEAKKPGESLESVANEIGDGILTEMRNFQNQTQSQ